MNQVLYDIRYLLTWTENDTGDCVLIISGGSQTKIHKPVRDVSFKESRDTKYNIGRHLATKDIFVFILYMEDFVEAARRILLDKDSNLLAKEVLEAVHMLLGDEYLEKLLDAAFSIYTPDQYPILMQTNVKDIKEKLSIFHTYAIARDAIIRACSQELPRQSSMDPLINVGDWIMTPRTVGSFFITEKTTNGNKKTLVLFKSGSFTVSTSGILGEEPRRMVSFRELVRSLQLHIENIKF